MTLKETLNQLKALGNEKMRAHNTKNGASDNQFGVKLGDIRVLAKKIKTNHESAMSLWETGNADPEVRWMMNSTLAKIGIHFPELRKRGHRHWREVGNLSGLSRFEGSHLTLRPDLD